MNRISIYASVAVATAGCLLIPAAMARAPEQSGISHVSGGVGIGGREQLAARAKDFNFKLVTAMQKSGQYIAGANVTVKDAKDKEVLRTTMRGPWLLADLPPGTYHIAATHGGQTLTKTVTIPPVGHREAYLYWPVHDQIANAPAPASAHR